MKRSYSYLLLLLLVLSLCLVSLPNRYWLVSDVLTLLQLLMIGLMLIDLLLLCRRSAPEQRPPLNAEFLFHLFLDPKNCDALVGDLEERYRTIRKRFGTGRANFWYWVQVIASIGPIVWVAAKRVLRTVSGVAALVEVWRRIRS